MAVAFDALSPGASGQVNNGTGGALASWTHTVGAGVTQSLVIVGVTVGASNDASVTTSVTYGGAAMTSLAKKHSNNGTGGYIEVFYKVGVSTGAGTVAVTASGTITDLTGGAVSFDGVDQTTSLGTPVTAFGSSATASTGAMTSAVANMLFALTGYGDPATGSNNTQRWSAATNANTTCGYGIGATAAGAASVTMSTAGNGSHTWAIVGVDVKAGGAAAGGPPMEMRKSISARAIASRGAAYAR